MLRLSNTALSASTILSVEHTTMPSAGLRATGCYYDINNRLISNKIFQDNLDNLKQSFNIID